MVHELNIDAFLKYIKFEKLIKNNDIDLRNYFVVLNDKWNYSVFDVKTYTDISEPLVSHWDHRFFKVWAGPENPRVGSSILPLATIYLNLFLFFN